MRVLRTQGWTARSGRRGQRRSDLLRDPIGTSQEAACARSAGTAAIFGTVCFVKKNGVGHEDRTAKH